MNNDLMKSEISKYDPPESEKRRDAYTSLYYIIVLILCGIPMWFITTSTYRASLPVSEILELGKSKISIVIKINLINFNGKIELEEMFRLQDELLKDLEKLSKQDAFVKFTFNGYVRQAEKAEMKIYQFAKSLSDLDGITSPLDLNGIYILLLPEDTSLLGDHKNGLLRSKTDRNVAIIRTESMRQVKFVIKRLLVGFFTKSEDLNTVYQAALRVPDQNILNNVPNNIRPFFTRVRSSPHYRWTFSLIVPHPKRGSSVQWDFPRLERIFLEPLLRKLAPFVSISVSSQLIYGVRLKNIWPGDLTQLVNGLESYLGSTNGANNELHFVCILSDSGKSFKDTSGGTNAFTVPRWGGISIINTVHNATESDKVKQSGDFLVDEGTLAGLFFQQILTVMGLTSTVGKESILPIEPFGDGVFLSPWQLESWLRERTVENLAITQVTLQSIVDLLDKVVNMVIRDDVAASIIAATKLAKNSLAALKSSSTPNSLHIAFLSSKQALEAAETAFFDPSLLELLYFQDDQKIGIYIPLFVPVILPVLLAALKVKPYLQLLFKSKSD